ncbi:ABC transporter ATP-binding protein [Urechidicola croceus]|uniref:ABC transporter ATP-binding protein n=1 Tax=Urechidicola croceus TaxID=1850246 RepID=A0A1D8P947_9FLAO|nr:ABC transporter ATP-binding protein [Urechidicola croceus]AOW21097.1 ABC transporter ATP-binding protein [Urechidicola croceus]
MLKVQNISFTYDKIEVIKNISFSTDKGKYLAIVGESGCGKSTLLEIIYGLLHVEKGTVSWNDEKLLGPNFYLIPGEDFMKYLPQDFDLMPYITVEENIGKNISFLDENRLDKIKKLLDVVDMSEFLKTKVVNLSQGQKQRVAIAKVIAKEPEVLLLDEPFSNIDNFRKNKLRRNLFNYLKSKNITLLVATHDATDALSFADEILVMKDGKIIEKNTPEKLYQNPSNVYVGSLFNEINEIPSEDLKFQNPSKKTVLLYPNQLKIVGKSEIKATVIQSYFKGNCYLIEAKLVDTIIYFEHHNSIVKGLEIYLNIEK